MKIRNCCSQIGRRVGTRAPEAHIHNSNPRGVAWTRVAQPPVIVVNPVQTFNDRGPCAAALSVQYLYAKQIHPGSYAHDIDAVRLGGNNPGDVGSVIIVVETIEFLSIALYWLTTTDDPLARFKSA